MRGAAGVGVLVAVAVGSGLARPWWQEVLISAAAAAVLLVVLIWLIDDQGRRPRRRPGRRPTLRYQSSDLTVELTGYKPDEAFDLMTQILERVGR